MTKRYRPNIYVNSAELSHRLTAAAMTPEPTPMTEAERIMRDLDRGDQVAWGAFVVIVCLWIGLLWWYW